jgi:hypothetical protein
MPDYMLTVLSTGQGGIDVRVNAAADIREAMTIAERVTGCRVNHGRGGVLPGFDPAITIAAPTGDVIRHHHRAARIEVALGPPDVMRAIRAALAKAPKAPPRRKTGNAAARDE